MLAKKHLYILRLEDDKWYVGTTTNVIRRYSQHCTGNGAAFTRIYPPVDLVTSYKIPTVENTGLVEDMEVKRLMGVYGIDNVRGGSYSSITLSTSTFAELRRVLNHAAENCLECGKSDHWANQCSKRRIVCYRCGRDGHISPECYARSTVDGESL